MSYILVMMENNNVKPINYYCEKLNISYRKARRILKEPGGRVRLDNAISNPELYKLGDTTERVGSRVSARQLVIDLNKDSLLECSKIFNLWSKADHTQTKYTYNDAARLALSYIELCTKISISLKK